MTFQSPWAMRRADRFPLTATCTVAAADPAPSAAAAARSRSSAPLPHDIYVARGRTTLAAFQIMRAR